MPCELDGDVLTAGPCILGVPSSYDPSQQYIELEHVFCSLFLGYRADSGDDGIWEEVS